MKFAISISMERFSPTDLMSDAMSSMLALARIADEVGFETLWTAEHHTIECTTSPNQFTILTWLSQHMQRIRLGTATLVALYWSPIRLAGEAVMCDHLTGGRLEFGIARGAYQYEFDRMAGGTLQQEGVGYMKELVPAVQKLWAGDYAHDGHYWKFPACHLRAQVATATSSAHLGRHARPRQFRLGGGYWREHLVHPAVRAAAPKSRCLARSSARRWRTIPSIHARVS